MADLGDGNSGGWGGMDDGGGIGGLDASMNDGSLGPGSFGGDSLDSMFAAFDPTGYGITSSFGADSIGSVGSYSDARGEAMGFDNEGVEDSIFGKIGKFAQTPLGRFAQAAIARANPYAGMMTGMMSKANQASQSPSKAGGVFGGVVGGALGSMFGPIGGIAGSMAGSRMGSSAFGGVNNQGISGQPTGTGSSNPMDFATGAGMGLASLYQNYQNQKGLKGQIGTLQGMYGQGSPYAQALRQQLDRRDAAAGRRSQYGPREVELQAQLARMASGNAPTLANLYAQQRGQRGQNLAQLAGLYQQMGGWQGIRGGFNDLFGGMDLDTNGMGMGEISGGASADYFDPIYGD